MEITRTQSTEDRYIDLSKKLLASLEKSAGHEWEDNPASIIEWCEEKKTTISKSTWRQYRAALHFFLETNKYHELAKKILAIDQSECVKKSEKGPAKKLKKLPEADIVAIIDYMSDRKRKNGSHLDNAIVAWLVSGSVTGLRPVEWRDAYLEGRVLHVVNAKNTNGRACGNTRSLDLRNLDSKRFSIVIEMLNIVSKQDDFEKFYKACALHLYRMGKKIWPKRKQLPSLYSARHQFSADSKALELSSIEIAALMGHLSDETASLHYAKKRTGSEGAIMVIPSKENIDAVSKSSVLRHKAIKSGDLS